jgi:hypothetical protein
MLGYDVQVYEIDSNVSAEDLQRIGKLPYAERMSFLSTLTSRQVVHVAYRTWVDYLLIASEEGRVRMLQDGGYPYLFHAPGAEIKANFASTGVRALSALEDTTWYLVEAWDQS